MGQFRKKPIVINAEQFTGLPLKGVCNCYDDGEFHVHTAHSGQAVYLESGDWIIPEPDGEHYYPCKPDIFAATYEPVSANSEFQRGAEAGIKACVGKVHVMARRGDRVIRSTLHDVATALASVTVEEEK